MPNKRPKTLKDSFSEASNPESSMEAGPAFSLHHFTDGREDSETNKLGAATACLADCAAFHHVITIRP